MGKKEKEKGIDTDKTPNENGETMPKTEIVKAEQPKENKLALLGKDDPLFYNRYHDVIERVIAESPTQEDFMTIVKRLPPEQEEAILKIIKRFTGIKKGVYSTQDQMEFSELRLYQGTGNDPNRPKKQIPGEFYLNNPVENAGEFFEGAVLAIWAGRAMWGGEGESATMLCSSMDRIVGHSLGLCDKCLHRPWRDNKIQKCGDNVTAFMLSRDLKNIVMVRFNKTSEPGGRRLMRLTKSSEFLGDRWYKLTAEPKTGKQDASHKWYVINVEASGDNSPELTQFCDAMCSLLEGSYILPNIASCYQRGQSARDNQTDDVPGVMERVNPEAPSADYGDFSDAPKTTV